MKLHSAKMRLLVGKAILNFLANNFHDKPIFIVKNMPDIYYQRLCDTYLKALAQIGQSEIFDAADEKEDFIPFELCNNIASYAEGVSSTKINDLITSEFSELIGKFKSKEFCDGIIAIAKIYSTALSLLGDFRYEDEFKALFQNFISCGEKAAESHAKSDTLQHYYSSFQDLVKRAEDKLIPIDRDYWTLEAAIAFQDQNGVVYNLFFDRHTVGGRFTHFFKRPLQTVVAATKVDNLQVFNQNTAKAVLTKG